MLCGICLVVYNSGDPVMFGASRFIGYVDNNLDTQQANESKNGRETNRVISEVLGKEPVEDRRLEKAYRQFCRQVWD